MADSLDDFFAKKDKKRGKDKGKTVFSAESLVKELEEGSKQYEYPVRKDNKTSAAFELLGLDADDADWRDFEDVEKRDYTGLKVKEMSLQDQNEEEQRRLSLEQSDPAPESTPWKSLKEESPATTTTNELIYNAIQKASSDNNNTKAPDPTKSDTQAVSSSTDQKTTEQTGKSSQDNSTVDSTEKKGDKKSAKQAYVPPPERGLASGEVRILEPTKLTKSKNPTTRGHGTVPDIQDEQLFPSLG